MKFFLVTATALYLSLNLLIFAQEKYYEQQLDQYDLDGSGFFESDEQTKEQRAAMDLVIQDTGRTYAPYTLIPVALLLAGIATGTRAIWRTV